MKTVLKRVLARKNAAPQPVASREMKYTLNSGNVALFQGAGAQWTGRHYGAIARQGYQLNAVAYTAVRQVANACAQLQVKVYEQKHGQRRPLDESHPLVRLMSRPHTGESPFEFFYDIYAHLLLEGNAYVLHRFAPDKGREGEPVSMKTIRPDRVKVVSDGEDQVIGYRYTIDQVTRDYPVHAGSLRSHVLHVKTFNPLNDFYGQSALAAAMQHVDIFNAASTFNKSLLDNGARMTTALKFQETLAPDQRENLRRQFISAFTGARNAGKPIFLEGGMDIQELGVSPKDMEFLEANLMAARMIALSVGLPPFMLGLPGDNTFANMKEARLHFYLNTVKPMVTHVLSELCGYWQAFYAENLCVDVEWDTVEALSALREGRWQRIAEADFLTTEEKRSMLGLPPLGA